MAQSFERLMYKCDLCNYTTNRTFNLNRHHNGKHLQHVRACDNTRGCDKYVPSESINVPSESINVPSESINVPPESINVPLDSEIIVDIPNFTITMQNHENIDEPPRYSDNENVKFTEHNTELIAREWTRKLLFCKKCYKGYNNKKLLEKHEMNCNYVDSLTCPKCMMSFTSRQHKSRHVKRGNCKARSIIHAKLPNKDNIKNQVNNYATVHTQNNQCQTTINNLYINNYGSERMDFLNYDKYLDIFKKYYTIPSAMTKQLHFNIEFPENQNIFYNNESVASNKCNDEFVYKDLHILVEELIVEKSRIIQDFARDNKDAICSNISYDKYDEIIELLLKLVLVKEPSSQYKKEVKTIMDLIRNTRKVTTTDTIH
jgi:hypothetical protein